MSGDLAGIYGHPALTNEQFKGYALLFWKVGLINEAQFDALIAEHNSHNGKTFPEVIEALESQLRGKR